MKDYYSDEVEFGISFPAGWEEKKRLIDEALDKCLPRENEPPAIIHRAMRYALFPGGKRLRPLLTLTAAKAVGEKSRTVLPSACALELIHAYSLIHDDLPALDNDDYRRGKPSSHKAFGENIAILAGDALLTRAFGLISENEKVPGIDKGLIPLIIGEVARAVGTLGMIGGQVDDLEIEEGREATLTSLESIHRRKTGALLELCVKVGAILGGGRQEEIESLSRYGRNIGLAFQIGDDILDIKEEGKATYPTFLGLEGSRRRAAELIKKAKEELVSFEKRGETLKKMADLVLQRCSRDNAG